MNLKFCLSLFLLIYFNVISSQSKSSYDSILKLRKLSQNSNIPFDEQIKLAEEAIKLSYELNQDSVILKSGRILSLAYYNGGKDSLYLRINYQNLSLANKIKDSSSLEIVNSNLGAFFHSKEQNDSAFYYYSKALKLFDKSRNIDGKARTLLNIADIQETEKDYIGAEENAVEAIRLLNSTEIDENARERLWILNNLIGIISLKLKNYDKAIEYHNKAQEIAKKMDYGYYNNLYSINNKAIAYRHKEEIDKSIELYEQVISEDSLNYYDSSFYAITLGNLAYTKSFKPDRNIDEIKNIFYLGKNMSDTIADPLTKLGIAIDLSRFYLDIKESDSALYYADRSYKISDAISNNELKLESLLLLSKLDKEDRANSYLTEYIKLSDSLLNLERNKRNKFARIELETDQLEAKNEKISRDNFYLLLLSAGLLLTGILVYVVISQRAKNKELKLVQAQQEANEEIYNLMLNQQDNVEEARAQEKIRVSKELHDGVLGRLFGARLSLDSLNFSEGKEAMMNRANYIGQLKTIEDDIRKISHEMNTDFVAGSGFMDIVSELIDNQTKAYGFTYDFNYTDDFSWEFVPNKTKINIYRIIQESMQNTYKHAEAKHVKIDILRQKDEINIYIVDDGKGFDTSKSKKGIGLKNMTSRVSEIGGKISFSSEPGNGTTVKVKIPYSV
ncbi:tetratricopeptide repeat-containing sensor histidine kinase [uncultured Winogradskyella sp.]|uniref:ATP-binding protein n=1 Tax=uncultured Winogradskyella sp. TaxID=395353 RepID=UPI0026071FCF|nr:tetratricopeptide repeat-containing sensor histidine kinase [uncultured Winogradskyella sp.]